MTGARSPTSWFASLKAAFYVQGSSSNLSFQRFRQLTHIWLNHGDSDKRANFTPAHATFDKVFVAGQQGVERYAAHGVRIPASKMVVVGRPQIERIKPREHPPAPDAPRTILYAPTWQGGKPTTNYSSLGLGAKIVTALLERGATVIFRPHPFSYRDPGQARLARHIQQLLKQRRRAHGPIPRLGSARPRGTGTSRTASTTPTRWSPMSPRWPRTSWPPGSRSPWWRSSSAARRS